MSLALAAWLMASASLPVIAAEPVLGRGEVGFEGDVVSVRALATPVDEILRSIGPAAGFTVKEQCGPAGCTVVSGSRRGTLPEIIAWLLSRQNHLVLSSDVTTTGSSTAMARIVLLPSGLRSAVPNVPEETAPTQVIPTAQERRSLRRLQAARLYARGFGHRSSPGSGYQISSDFGWRRDPLDRQAKHHDGVDLLASTGTKIKSSVGGTVVFAGWAAGYGDMVEIEHGREMSTRYAHLSQVFVEAGERVLPRQTIALVGATGHSSGPHLHFEVRVAGRPADPFSMVHMWPKLESP